MEDQTQTGPVWKIWGGGYTKMLMSSFKIHSFQSTAPIQYSQTAPALTKHFANQIVPLLCRFVRAELWPLDQMGQVLCEVWKLRSGQRKYNVVEVSWGNKEWNQRGFNLRRPRYICKTKSEDSNERRWCQIWTNLKPIISRELLQSR